MVINSTTARGDILKEFIAVIKANLVTTGVKVTNSFVNDEAKLPQIVVGIPQMGKMPLTYNRGMFDRSGTIDIEVLHTTTKDLTQLYDDLEQAIDLNSSDLGVQSFSIGSSSEADIEVGSVMARGLVMPISFKLVR